MSLLLFLLVAGVRWLQRPGPRSLNHLGRMLSKSTSAILHIRALHLELSLSCHLILFLAPKPSASRWTQSFCGRCAPRRLIWLIPEQNNGICKNGMFEQFRWELTSGALLHRRLTPQKRGSHCACQLFVSERVGVLAEYGGAVVRLPLLQRRGGLACEGAPCTNAFIRAWLVKGAWGTKTQVFWCVPQFFIYHIKLCLHWWAGSSWCTSSLCILWMIGKLL